MCRWRNVALSNKTSGEDAVGGVEYDLDVADREDVRQRAAVAPGSRELVNLRTPALVLGMFLTAVGRAATPPTIQDFASRPRVEDVSISPDGRYVALIETQDGKAAAVVSDRQAGKDQVMRPVLSEPEHFRMTWCRWPTNTRLMCGFLGMVCVTGSCTPLRVWWPSTPTARICAC